MLDPPDEVQRLYSGEILYFDQLFPKKFNNGLLF